MKLNLQKTTAAVLAVVFSAGAFAANNAYNPFEYGYKNHKYGKKWGKPASEAEGEKVMKHAAYRSGVHYTNVNRMPGNVDRNGVKTVQVNDARTRQNLGAMHSIPSRAAALKCITASGSVKNTPKAPTAAFSTLATNALPLCRYPV